MKKKKTRFSRLVRDLIRSWIVQVVFAIWIVVLFVVVSKMDLGNKPLDFEKELEEKTPTLKDITVFPSGLIAPNPPTK